MHQFVENVAPWKMFTGNILIEVIKNNYPHTFKDNTSLILRCRPKWFVFNLLYYKGTAFRAELLQKLAMSTCWPWVTDSTGWTETLPDWFWQLGRACNSGLLKAKDTEGVWTSQAFRAIQLPLSGSAWHSHNHRPIYHHCAHAVRLLVVQC